MIPHRTDPAAPDSTAVAVTDLTGVLDVLTAIAESFPALPAPQIVISPERADLATLLVEHPSDFEAWRDTLGAHPHEVHMQDGRHTTWLSTTVRFMGADLLLTTRGIRRLPAVSLTKAAA